MMKSLPPRPHPRVPTNIPNKAMKTFFDRLHTHTVGPEIESEQRASFPGPLREDPTVPKKPVVKWCSRKRRLEGRLDFLESTRFDKIQHHARTEFFSTILTAKLARRNHWPQPNISPRRIHLSGATASSRGTLQVQLNPPQPLLKSANRPSASESGCGYSRLCLYIAGRHSALSTCHWRQTSPSSHRDRPCH